MATKDNGKTDQAEHEHGTMNTESQEKTFEGFIRITTWSVILIIALLIFIAAING